MTLFDTHTHYFDGRFAAEFPGEAVEAIRLAREAGVSRFLSCGTNAENSRASVELAARESGFFAAVGLHPEDCFSLSGEALEKELSDIRDMLKQPGVVAIGEIGLDYHYPDETDKEKQAYVLERQLRWAEDTGLPVIIHSRDAAGDTFDVLRQHHDVRGVLHSFSGSPEMARQYASLGWYISFSGTVSYKTAEKVRECARVVPSDKLLIETDCPYLAPVPNRGKINYSGYLPDTCRAVAAAINMTPDDVAELTFENGCRLFGIS